MRYIPILNFKPHSSACFFLGKNRNLPGEHLIVPKFCAQRLCRTTFLGLKFKAVCLSCLVCFVHTTYTSVKFYIYCIELYTNIYIAFVAA